MKKNDARKRRSIKSREIARQSLRPRLLVHRTNGHIYAQVIVCGDKGDLVVASASTLSPEIKDHVTGSKSEKAFQVGKLVASRAMQCDVKDVAFDRAGYKYHGRVKAIADGAREAGLNF
jgi:large subunit ribosomal protein L18